MIFYKNGSLKGNWTRKMKVQRIKKNAEMKLDVIREFENDKSKAKIGWDLGLRKMHHRHHGENVQWVEKRR